MARIGAIDIGSNALRLRVVDVDPPVKTGKDYRYHPFHEVHAERVPVRLGHDVFTKGVLEPKAINLACEALKRFRLSMDALKVERYRAVATSATREARNGELFCARAHREAGVVVEIIEGVEEARLVALAVCERVRLDPGPVVLIDIGGGSTELTLLKQGQAVFSRSAPMGTVRILESFLADEKISKTQKRIAGEYIARGLTEVLPELQEAAGGPIAMLIGTGGNIDTLADLCPARGATPDLKRIDVSQMRELVQLLMSLTLKERADKFSLRADRADTIVPASLVLEHVAASLGQEQIVAPGVGLKEGVLVDLARTHFATVDTDATVKAVHDTCMRLGRRYRFDEPHAALVAKMADKLFEALAPVHRLEARDRLLLHAAAILHDIGDYVRYEGHHKHSHYLIAHSDIMGLLPDERNLVANVARYHRKSAPSLDHPNFRELTGGERSRVKTLAAILRVADALDKEHLGKVADIGAYVDGDTLHIRATTGAEIELEAWTVKGKADLLREYLGLEVKLAVAAMRRSKPPSA